MQEYIKFKADVVALGAAYYAKYLDGELFASKCGLQSKWTVSEAREESESKRDVDAPEMVELVQNSDRQKQAENAVVQSAAEISSVAVTR